MGGGTPSPRANTWTTINDLEASTSVIPRLFVEKDDTSVYCNASTTEILVINLK